MSQTDTESIKETTSESPGRVRETTKATSIETPSRNWMEKVGPILIGILVPLVVTIIVTTSSTIVGGDKTSAVLTSQVQAIREDIKEQNTDFKDTKRLMQEILLKQGTLLTRDEAERRFQALSERISEQGRRTEDSTRRIEALEASGALTQRLLQQILTDRVAGQNRR